MSTGKWTDPAFPRKEWRYADYRELEGRTAICEACESRQIRFQHLLTHRTGLSLWVCGECGCELCPYGNAIHAVEAKMRSDAADRASRTLVVPGISWISTPPDWFLPKNSPLELRQTSPYTMLTILPCPNPIAMDFRITGAGGWVGGGDKRGTLFGCAIYKNHYGKPCETFPNIGFGAVLLRHEDIAAIDKLTHGKRSSYTVLAITEFGESPRVIWREVGAATYKRSSAFLTRCAAEFMDEGLNWKLDKVMDASMPDMEDEPPWADFEELL